MRTRRTFILAVASVAVIGLLLVMFTGSNLPPIKGSLSENDARAVLKEVDNVRWRAAYLALRKWQFRLFWRFVSENFRLYPVSVDGDLTQAVVECRDHSGLHSATYRFTRNGGFWGLTDVSHVELFKGAKFQLYQTNTTRPAP